MFPRLHILGVPAYTRGTRVPTYTFRVPRYNIYLDTRVSTNMGTRVPFFLSSGGLVKIKRKLTTRVPIYTRVPGYQHILYIYSRGTQVPTYTGDRVATYPDTLRVYTLLNALLEDFQTKRLMAHDKPSGQDAVLTHVCTNPACSRVYCRCNDSVYLGPIGAA